MQSSITISRSSRWDTKFSTVNCPTGQQINISIPEHGSMYLNSVVTRLTLIEKYNKTRYRHASVAGAAVKGRVRRHAWRQYESLEMVRLIKNIAISGYCSGFVKIRGVVQLFTILLSQFGVTDAHVEIGDRLSRYVWRCKSCKLKNRFFFIREPISWFSTLFASLYKIINFFVNIYLTMSECYFWIYLLNIELYWIYHVK